MFEMLARMYGFLVDPNIVFNNRPNILVNNLVPDSCENLHRDTAVPTTAQHWLPHSEEIVGYYVQKHIILCRWYDWGEI